MKDGRSGERVSFARAALIGSLFLYAGLIAYHHYFDSVGTGFDRQGIGLIGYHFARVGLAAYLIVISCGLGYWLLASVGQHTQLNGAKAFICCFFLGASVYGFGFSVLGLFSALSLPIAIAATLPVLLFVRSPFRAIWAGNEALSAVFKIPPAGDKIEGAIRLALIGLACLVVLIFFVTRVLFIPNPDGNIWEHYLHYYRSVLESGTTLPGEVWHHFYNSKGGGLFFVSIFLGDVFAVQLVSTCFVIAAGVIIFDLLQDLCADLKWALLGVVLYFSFFFGDVSDGGMFRVHAVILGYAAFAFWAWEQLSAAETPARRAILISMLVSLGYIGFFQPVATAVFAPTFVVIAVARRLFGTPGNLRLAFICGFVVAAGTLVTICINWLLTGLPEITPIKLLWAVGDQQKAAEVFGTGGIDFFLAVNNDLVENRTLLQRIYGNLRYLPSKPFMYLTFAIAGLLAIRAFVLALAGRPLERAERFVLAVALFLLPFVSLALIFPSPSLVRMGLYSIFFVVLATVVVWHRAIDFLSPDLLMNPLGLSWRGTNKPFDVPLKQMAAATFVVVVAAGMLVLSAKATQYRSPIYRFARADVSLKGTMERMEEVNPRLVSETTVNAISEFRSQTGYTGRVLALVYDAGYAYFIPGAGIVSEPTYALVKEPARLLAEAPERVANYLRDRKLEYVSVNLPSRLFTTFAFTSLFQPSHLRDYFDVAYERGDLFVLRLRKKEEKSQPMDEHRIPDYVLSTLELKRQGVLHFPFTAEFYSSLSRPGKGRIVSAGDFDAFREDFIREMQGLIAAKMINKVEMPQSKDVLRKLSEAATTAVRDADPAMLTGARRASNDDLVMRLPEAILRQRMIDYVRDEIRKEYVARFGERLASLSERCDERVPFAPDRPISATCL